ncbi:hypothetical protein DL96DRAFT_1553881 [Flagelloscypha sp. PMI_526]|nr:hypothetical protein DL96DRAFT_1553881 [Flagelloscypha sp. PMI_526]
MVPLPPRFDALQFLPVHREDRPPLIEWIDVNTDLLAQLKNCVCAASNSPRSAFLLDATLQGWLERSADYIYSIDAAVATLERCLSSMQASRNRLIEVKLVVKALLLQPVLPLPELPEDIVRYILEMCARENGVEHAKMLTLLSRQVQSWVDPLLFENIYLRLESGRRLAPDHLLTALKPASRPPSQRMLKIGQNITNLVLVTPQHLSFQTLQGLSPLLPGLHSLEITGNEQRDDIPGHATFYIPTLRHLHWPSSTLDHPAYQPLTHLSLQMVTSSVDQTRNMYNWVALSQLSNLRYLSLRTPDELSWRDSGVLVHPYATMLRDEVVPLLHSSVIALLWRSPSDLSPRNIHTKRKQPIHPGLSLLTYGLIVNFGRVIYVGERKRWLQLGELWDFKNART